MEFKIIYKLDITILENESHDGKSPQEIEIKNNKKNKKNMPKGETCVVKGSADKIKKEICQQIDKLSQDLKEWYYGEER